MHFSTFAVAILVAVSRAAPSAVLPKARRATTASERLGLTWLGGNSSLPKILYAIFNYFLLVHPLISTVYCTQEVPLPAAPSTELSMTPSMANFRSVGKRSLRAILIF
jgi:hypothetical protein